MADRTKRSRSLTLTVKAGLKAGKLAANHSTRTLRVKAGLKAGKIATNHSARAR